MSWFTIGNKDLEKHQTGESEQVVFKSDSETLADRASHILGYVGLKDYETVKKALDELNIAPFSITDVESYQIKQLEEFREKTKNSELDWNWDYLENFRGPIPVNVLEMAVKIKEKLPDVILKIRHLKTIQRDPFLYFSYKSAPDTYVAVWDEPTFDIVDAQLKV